MPFQLLPNNIYPPEDLERSLQWQSDFYRSLHRHPLIAVLILASEESVGLDTLLASLSLQSDSQFSLSIAAPEITHPAISSLLRHHKLEGKILTSNPSVGRSFRFLLQSNREAELVVTLGCETLLHPAAIGILAKLHLTQGADYYTANQVLLSADRKRATGFFRRGETGRYTALSADLHAAPAIFGRKVSEVLLEHPFLDELDDANLYRTIHCTALSHQVQRKHIGLGLSLNVAGEMPRGNEAIARRVLFHFSGVMKVPVREISFAPDPAQLRARLTLEESPGRVQVIIPFRNQSDLTLRALASLERQEALSDLEVTLVDNNSEANERDRIDDFLARSALSARIVTDTGYFNYARLNNRAAAQGDTPYILFLNNDVELTTPQVINELRNWCALEDVGAVGSELRYENGRLQHGGINFIAKRPCNVAFESLFPSLLREVNGVTFACAMVKRAAFNRVGGLDELHCPNGFGDALFAHQLTSHGYRILLNPEAKGTHRESATRGALPEDIELFDMVLHGLPIADCWEDFQALTQPAKIFYRLSGPYGQLLRKILRPLKRKAAPLIRALT